jgi:hypothetical protein
LAAHQSVLVTLDSVLVSHQSVVVALEDVLGTLDLIVVALHGVATTKNGVAQSEGLIEVPQNGSVGSDQTVTLSAYSVIISLQLVARPRNHVAARGGGFSRTKSTEEAIGGEEGAELLFLFLCLIEGAAHVGEQIHLEGVAGDVDGLCLSERGEEEKQSHEKG